jgi:aryl-alcohol dehydrogenase-like predicted oxidoreductase
MNYRTLGKSGLRISEIGLGCWEIGGDFWHSNDQQAMEALHFALKLGINFFDTAFDYGQGHSEQLVGKMVKENPKAEIVIATKVPPKDGHWPAIDSNIQNVFPKEHIIDYAMKSYTNLGERTIDLLQLHVWRDEWANESCWQEAFQELKKDRIIRFTGVSLNDHAPESGLNIASSGKIDSIMVIYNIFDQSPEDKLFDVCIKNKVGVIARVPFDEGSLTGKLTKSTKLDDWRKNYFTAERLEEVVDRVGKLKWIETPNRTLAQAALQFCLHHPAVTTVIPGSTNSKHIADNVSAANGKLSKDEIQKIKAHRWVRNFYQQW